jgi:creatinine amidohydrolase
MSRIVIGVVVLLSFQTLGHAGSKWSAAVFEATPSRQLAVHSVPTRKLVQTKSPRKAKGVILEDLSWTEAEKILTPDTVVVIPLGAAAKEHGPHLKLKNDFVMAEYLKGRVLRDSNVVVAPTLNYHFYPAFVEYPGSTTLRLETARDMVVDICRTLARFGPRRFYILNTGISTLRALKPTADLLAAEGILVRYTDLRMMEPVEKTIRQQEGGTHADEIETSMMLYMAPALVDMKKAVKDYHPEKVSGGLTRDPHRGVGVYSPSGIWGDPTLATRAKGKKVTEFLVAGILREIEELRAAPLPRL